MGDACRPRLCRFSALAGKPKPLGGPEAPQAHSRGAGGRHGLVVDGALGCFGRLRGGLGGDVVDGGRAEQYPIYRRIRDGIGKPVHEIPGNHDPEKLFEKHLGQPADRFFERGGIRFGLFGLLGNNAVAVSPMIQPLTFADPVATARETVAKLREEEE